MARWAPLAVALVLSGALTLNVQASHELVHVRWEAPLSSEGDWALRFEVSLPQPTWCELTVEAAGAAIGPAVHLLVEAESGAASLYRSSSYASAHHGGSNLVPLGGGEYRWAGGAGTYGVFSPGEGWTVAAFGTRAWSTFGGEVLPPLVLDVACEGPVALASLEGSREASAFGVWTPQDGTGAATFFGAAVNLGDSVEATLASSQVEFLARFDSPGYRSLRVEHPDGTSTTTGVTGADWDVVGGPGAWRVSIDRASPSASFTGLFLGFEPLASLDELVA